MSKIDDMAMSLNENPNLQTVEENLIARISYKDSAKDILSYVIERLAQNGISTKFLINEIVV